MCVLGGIGVGGVSVKDTGLLCVGESHAGRARVGQVAVEGHLQRVAVGVLIQAATQGPVTHRDIHI